MTKQLRLPGIEPPKQITAAAAARVPVLWIRRLVILRELASGPEHIIREVELRRGLNIVWTPPGTESATNALFRSGVSSHTAGKSTLCRLLRYVLGERVFATERTRKRIREKFPGGWVLGEVFVGDELWTVARPFGIGAHPFCVPGLAALDAITSTDRREYQTFLDALERASVSCLPSKAFPSSSEPVRWEHLLPWLTRDQECRFADFLEWRHSASHAESPALNADERQFLVRAVLGLISEAEQAEQSRNVLLVGQRREASRRAPLLVHQASIDHARVQRLLSRRLSEPSTELFASEARSQIQQDRGRVVEELRVLEEVDPRRELRIGLDTAIAAETNARRDLTDAEARLAAEEGALTSIAPASPTSLLSTLPPPRDYCNVPMSLARDRGCPLADSRPVEIAARRSERTAAEEIERQRGIVVRLRSVVAERRTALAVSVAATAQARRSFFEASTLFENRRVSVLEEQARLNQVERFVAEAEDAWRDSRAQVEAIDRLSKEIDASYAKQEELRQEGRAALARFSSTFDYAVRALLGDEVSARVEPSGRSLELIVEHRGERESAAIATVKLLAFDLAAMTEAVQGNGSFARFLIHDGPREADLAADIFERVFLYAKQLEQCFDGEPGFQYIVATTSPPPAELLKAPWHRLTLFGAPPEERLLRCDL